MNRPALGRDTTVSGGARARAVTPCHRTGPIAALSHRLAAVLLSTTALSTPAFAAETLPTGPRLVAGAATIATTGSALTVTQGSDRAIVNWNAFSIGAGASVTFVQPGASAAILNRVTGDTPSSIAGRLTGNGQIFLINPNGIAITRTGTVEVGGGFVASTLGIADADFLSGRHAFKGGGASAAVSNDGVVAVGRGGYAALIGGTVRNSGLVAVPMGKVGLGSGEQATLDLSGDGFLQVAVPTRAGAEGKSALIEAGGRIAADGGTVVMRAATARDAARRAINLSGVVEANSISGRNGAIVIGGGAGGSVAMTGKVTAKSRTGKGGKVTVTGRAIALAGASIDVSGATGGGTVKIGGDRQGKGITPHADTVTIDAASMIRADATGDGDGGSVVVWSDTKTAFAGLITARGAGLGVGGDAEVSGKKTLDYAGYADLSGPRGFGTLLLDPYNVTISADPAANSTGTTATGENSVINVGTLQNALAGANVAIATGAAASPGTQAGDIVVAAPVSWSANTVLTLNAANQIAINADISATGRNAGLVLNYGDYANTGTAAPGTDYAIADGVHVTLSGAQSSLAINGTSYTLIRSRSGLEAVDAAPGGSYALATDVDLSGASYTAPLAGRDPGTPFSGTLAGLGHTVSNLRISASVSASANVGLVGLNTGTIRDLNLTNATVQAAQSSVSGIAVGLVAGSNSGTLAHVSVQGSVTVDTSVNGSTVYVGGLAGRAESGSLVTGATASVAVAVDVGTTPSSQTAFEVSAGGLVGFAAGAISKSSASGDLNAWARRFAYIGGLVGQNTGTITDAWSSGNVTGQEFFGDLATEGTWMGGLVGWLNGGTIVGGRAFGRIYDQPRTHWAPAGGLVGRMDGGSIDRSYATGDVSVATSISSHSYAGGLVGAVYRAGSISNSYATGSVAGENFAGGLIGYGDNPTITNAYATGTTQAQYATGGLVGLMYGGTLTGVYASGPVATAPYTGGLVGSVTTGNVNGTNYVTSLAGAYFDRETTGQSAGIGTGTPSSGSAVGLTTAQARTQAGYAGWDFSNIWYQVADMRPILRSEVGTPAGGVVPIDSLHQIALIQLDLSARYALTRDIDAAETNASNPASVWGPSGWQPVGTSSQAPFSGSFDGGRHKISGLTIDAAAVGDAAYGLFGIATGAIHDVRLDGGAVTVAGSGAIEAGMLAGRIETGSVQNVYATGRVSVTSTDDAVAAGGLVGVSYEASIINAFATGDIDGHGNTGALVGGLVGANQQVSTRGTIATAYATGSVSATADFGIVYAGGLAGYSTGAISDAYAQGAVTVRAGQGSSSFAAGGLIGSSSGTVTRTYATGAVTVPPGQFAGVVGGLVGQNGGTITASYYDDQTSGQAGSVGQGSAAGVTGLTTAELQDPNGFLTRATASGWSPYDWAPPSAGFYPSLSTS